MTPEVLAALRRVVDEIGADAGVLLRLGPSGTGIVTSSTLVPFVCVGDDWGPPAVMTGGGDGPELVVDPERLGTLVPAAARPALAADPTAALVAPLDTTASRIVLIWTRTPPPADVVSTLESVSLHHFTLLGPLLDAQVEADESVRRQQVVAGALDQAVVVTAGRCGRPHINPAAARLLGLDADSVDADALSAAMRALRDRATDPAELANLIGRLSESTTSVVRDWVWTLHGSPSHLRVTTAPVETNTGPGRVWVFDDISAEMALVESERRVARALAESEQRYRILAENVSDVVVQGSDSGVIEWVSPSVTTMVGWAPSDLVGTPFLDLVHPHDQEIVAAAQVALTRGEHTTFEVRVRTGWGDHRWMSIRVKPLLGDDGRIVGQVAAWWDAQASHDAREELERSEQRASEALAESEQRYKLLAENVSDVVVQGTAEGTITWVSPSVTATLGWAPEDLIGRSFRDVVHPDHVPALLTGQERLLQGEHVQYEVPVRTAGGDHRWMEVRAKPLVDEEGRVVGRIAGWWDAQASHDARDELERHERLTNQALAASEERYRLLAENVSDVVVLFDTEGVVTWVSPSVTATLGWAPDDLVGRTAERIVNPDHWEGVTAHRELLLRGERVEYEVQMRTAGGDYRWIAVRATPFRHEHGHPAGLIAGWWDYQAVHDARAESERSEQRAAQALAESEERYRLLAENVSDVVMMGTSDGILTWVSPSVTATLGWAPEDILGTTFPEYVRPDHLGFVLGELKKARHGEHVTFELPVRAAGGDYRWMEMRVKLLVDDHGGVVGRVAALWDIQAAHDAREELERSERRAAETLAESEHRYRMLAENVSDVVVQGSAEGIIDWVSPSVTMAVGWSPEDLVGTAFLDLVHPGDRAVVAAAQSALAGGEQATFEVRVRTATGDHRWMSIRVKPVLDRDGRVVGRVAAWWDHHVAHEAMDQLARSESRYRLLLENTSEVVFQTVDGLVTWLSPASEEVTGWPPTEVVGSTSEHLWHPDDWKRISDLHDDAREGAHGREVLRLRTPEGLYRWMEIVIRPYREPDGRPATVGMMYDVSERVRAQEAARASEARYRMVAENASDVVCRYRADGVIEWIFGSTETFLGRSAEEIVGTSLIDHFVSEDWGDRADIRARLSRGEAVQLLARLRHADGGTRWVEVRAQAVMGADGSLESLIGTMRDAQAEVEYQEALAASERQARNLVDAYEAARDEAIRASTAKTAFLSRMSHELRTPLNAVLGFAQLLALDPLTQEQADSVQHIRTGGRHLLDLINEIVDISRIEAGRLSLTMSTVDASAVLADAAELVRELARQHDIAVMATVATTPVPDVHADRQRVTQVLLNLMSNAVKYNRPGGSVRVGCRAGAPGEVVFEVSDTGPGIPDAMLPRLFEPFDRLGAERSDVEGTGIGLALAEALARAMGGRIEVSTEVGTGSTFSLVLRVAPSAPASGLPVGEAPDAQRDARLHILYIEDNPTNATLMARVVALRPGSRLQVEVDGLHGIGAALAEPPDLIFLDLHLPDLSGEEVLRRLRRVPGCADVPVVVVTADASPRARERMTLLGCDGFLTKPFDVDDVLGWIDATASDGVVL